jgi:hypothetical protein
VLTGRDDRKGASAIERILKIANKGAPVERHHQIALNVCVHLVSLNNVSQKLFHFVILTRSAEVGCRFRSIER